MSPRLAIVGCGQAGNHHASALERLGWHPVLVIDPDPERAAVFARRFGARSSTDIAAAFDGIDAAVIATPPHTHASIACRLMEHGVAVLVEKPMAPLVADAEAMMAVVEQGGRLVLGNQRRQLAGWRWMKAALTAGTLGSLHHFAIEDGTPYGGRNVALSFWRPGPDGGGVLMDLGPHGIDLMHWWFGAPVDVDYRDDRAGGIETDAVAEVRMASGLQGRLEVSQVRRLSRKVRVLGDKGEVAVNLYTGAVEILSGDLTPPVLPRQTGPDAFLHQMRLWRDSLSGKPIDGELVDGRAGLDVITFIRRCYALRQPLRPSWRKEAIPAVPAAGQRRVVVVTGASGFIGGRAVEKLLERDDVEVRPVVRSYDRCTRLARLPVEMTKADFGDKDAMRQVLRGADAVLHAGFDPRATADHSVAAAVALADAAMEAGVRRFVHVSSTAIYQPFVPGRLDEAVSPPPPPEGYARTKWRIEQEVLRRTQAGLSAIILQPGIVYGAFGRLWTDRVVQYFDEGTVAVPSDAEGWCNAVHVDDVVQTMLLAMDAPDALSGERFIVTGPDVIDWADYFNRYAAMIGSDRTALRMPAAQITRILARRAAFARVKTAIAPLRTVKGKIVAMLGADGLARIDAMVDGRSGRDRCTLPEAAAAALYATPVRLDPGKAMAKLGYRPEYDIESGLKEMGDYVRWAFPAMIRSGPNQRG